MFWSYHFFLRVEKLSIYSISLVLTRPRHCAQALHTTRYNYLRRSLIHVSRLDACQYTWFGKTQSFGVRCQISHPVFSVFHCYFQRLICSAYVAVWGIFCFYIARYRIKQVTGYFLACIGPMNFEQKCQEPRYIARAPHKAQGSVTVPMTCGAGTALGAGLTLGLESNRWFP